MQIKEVVKEKYGQAALRVNSGGSSCCGATGSLEGVCDPITSNLYDASQTGALPEEAVRASLGCGNPTALARPCSIWGRAAGLTFYFRLGGWVRQARLMDST